MLPCLGPSSSAAKANGFPSPSTSQGYSVNNTPRTSALTSPTVNLTREYTLVVHTISYGEIWSKIHHDIHSEQTVEFGQVEIHEDPEILGQVLQPSHEHVNEALSRINPTPLTKLIASYFDHSEKTSQLCLLLYKSVHHARLLYAPLHNVVDILPPDIGIGSHSINQSQCDWTFDIFLQFDSFDNPFPSPDSQNFDDIRLCFSQLRQELDQHLRKSRSKVQILRHATTGSAICLIAATVGVAISAVVIATHALVALVASPLCTACLPSKITKEELSHLSQIDAAAKGTYVLHNDLDTIDRLVTRLYAAIEGDKLLIRLGLERGRDRHPIQEIVRQLRKSLPTLTNQLTDLEEHICLCFAAINRARQLLLDELYLHKIRD